MKKPPEMPDVLRSGPSVSDLGRRREPSPTFALSRQTMRLGAIASNVAFAVLGGAAIGYGLDWLLGTGPWLFLGLALLGLVGGLVSLVGQTRKLMREEGESMRGVPPTANDSPDEQNQ